MLRRQHRNQLPGGEAGGGGRLLPPVADAPPFRVQCPRLGRASVSLSKDSVGQSGGLLDTLEPPSSFLPPREGLPEGPK